MYLGLLSSIIDVAELKINTPFRHQCGYINHFGWSWVSKWQNRLEPITNAVWNLIRTGF